MTKSEQRRISKVVRAACGQTGTPYSIEYVDGFAAPKLVGQSYYHTTLSGRTVVTYPNAYDYPTLYHASTRRIEVGRGWVTARLQIADTSPPGVIRDYMTEQCA
jgi:hypothetical protein